MICQTCGNMMGLAGASTVCGDCGKPATLAGARTAAQRREEVPDPGLYAACIGPRNQGYYLKRFGRFDRQGKSGASWHWPAFFITFYWLLYRKMWRNALIYFLLPYLVLVPLAFVAGLFGEAGVMAAGALYLLYLVAIFILPPVYANALYHSHCRQKIREADNGRHSRERVLGELSGRGGTSNIVLFIFLVLFFFMFVGVLAAIAIPAYQDYTTRSRTGAAYQFMSQAAHTTSVYYASNGRLPASLADAAFAQPLPVEARNLKFDEQRGVITLVFDQGVLAGKSLQMLASVNAHGELVWQCTSKDIKAALLPAPCRL